VSGGVLAGALGVTVLATLIFAIGPAVICSRVELEQALRSGVRQSAGKRSRLLQEAIVASQVALALLVLSAAALVARSFSRLEHSELAFEPAHLLVAELAFRAGHHDSGPEQAALLEQLLSALRTVPGVDAVSTVVAVPYASTRSWEGRPSLEGQSEEDAARQPLIDIEVVAPSFFASLGLPVLRGRGFSDADRKGASAVVVLSQSAARHYWPGRDPIGKHIVIGPPTEAYTATVVGIVPDMRYRDLREPHASIYYPLAQSFFPFAPTTLVVRSARAPSDLAAAMRGMLAETTPDIVLASVRPFDALIAGPLAQPRMNALLLAVFASAALVLAAVGLFGVLAMMVRQRTRELAVRMAMGASPTDVARLVIQRAVMLATIGAAAGLLGALALNRLLGALLFEISPTDATTLAAVTASVFGVATIASLLPARSSARIEPGVALRAD
jgi:putative ABC transport system permease protein